MDDSSDSGEKKDSSAGASPSREGGKHGSAGASPSRDAAPSAEPAPPPKRKHPAHGVEIATSLPTIVFLTVCTKGRAPWLASPDVHAQLRSVWQTARAWLVGRYVIMPGHIHQFIAPGNPELPLENWVRYWKSHFTKLHANAQHCWQPDHWDRRLRSGESYAEKWDYVRANPVRH